MIPPATGPAESRRTRRRTVRERAPAAGVSLALAAAPVVAVCLLSYPLASAVALSCALVATAALGVVRGR
jgi:VIT1/CCC1 family predicted Fe2+/Mn2+ transporter